VKGSQNTSSLQIMVDRSGSEPLTSAVQTQYLLCGSQPGSAAETGGLLRRPAQAGAAYADA
jgi:hypothetical protein